MGRTPTRIENGSACVLVFRAACVVYVELVERTSPPCPTDSRLSQHVMKLTTYFYVNVNHTTSGELYQEETQQSNKCKLLNGNLLFCILQI